MSEPISSPSTDEWNALYAAGIAFRDLAPWQWVTENQVFGVQNPEDGQIGYVVIMGELKEVFALALYEGSEGLNGLYAMQHGVGADNPVDLLVLQKCLMASCENREQLDKEDLALMKALGLKFRGRNAWVQFRSYEPGFVPWYLTAPQARFLTLALQQVTEIAQRLQENPRLLPRAREWGEYLVRVPENTPEGLVWHDERKRPVPLPSPTESPCLPPELIAQAHQLMEMDATHGILEMDYFLLPQAVQEKKEDRPSFPYMIMAADSRSGMLIATDMVPRPEVGIAFAETLLTVVERLEMRPDTVLVSSKETAALLKPVADILEIHVKPARRLPAIAEARKGLSQFMGRGGGRF